MSAKESILDEQVLLEYLRQETGCPDLQFLHSPAVITGGYESKIYRIQLQGTPESLTGDLVLRVLPPPYSESHIVLNKTLHNYLNSKGYPTPKVHIICLDRTVLGRSFYMMDFVEGDLMFDHLSDSTPKMLARIHSELHSLDPEPLIMELDKEGVQRRHFSGFDSFTKYVSREGRECMRPALTWRPGTAFESIAG